MRIDHASMSALSLTKVRMSYNETHITSNTMDLCCSITRIYGMYRIRIYHTQNSLQRSTDARSRHEFEINGQQQCTGQNNAMKSMGRAMHHGMVNVVIEQRLVSNHFKHWVVSQQRPYAPLYLCPATFAPLWLQLARQTPAPVIQPSA